MHSPFGRRASVALCTSLPLLLLLTACGSIAAEPPVAEIATALSASGTGAGVSADDCGASSQLFGFDELYNAVAQDLASADLEDALNYRYLTLSNRFIAGGCAGAALELDRQALTKAVNMLSVASALEAPRPIDAARLIYRIDLRDYDFDRVIAVNGQSFNDVWEAIITANPYAVTFTGVDADVAREAAGTDVPVLFSDSFIETTMSTDLYYAIIGLDARQTLDAFIANDLLIDVAANLRSGRAVRAATTRSRISRQDRVVQRDDIEIRQGVLWQSFDFEDDQNESIFESPFDFSEEGREAIFTLPNGLLAFASADDEGALLLESSVRLFDTLAGQSRANPISCLGCHADGFQPVVDEVGPTSLTSAAALGLTSAELQQIQSVYIAAEQFQRVIDQDSLSFQRSLGSLALPTNGSDPVSSIYLQFDRDLSLADAAGDLGISPALLSQRLPELHPVLSLLDSTVLDRDDVTDVYVDSLCKLSADHENAPDLAQCDQAAAVLTP